MNYKTLDNDFFFFKPNEPVKKRKEKLYVPKEHLSHHDTCYVLIGRQSGITPFQFISYLAFLGGSYVYVVFIFELNRSPKLLFKVQKSFNVRKNGF